MTIGAEEQTNSDQGVGTTDLKSELRCLLADDFRKRLTESALISEEQCKRLCGLLREGQNLTNISKALGVSREQPSSIAVLDIFQYTLQQGDKSERQ